MFEAQNQRGLRDNQSPSSSSGEGGIRTRGGVLRPLTGLANRRYRPLSHLSGLRSMSRQFSG
jgi:hypothetical protein